MCDRFFRQICMGYPLKDKRTIAVLNVFIEIVNKCKHKPNKLRVDQ